jgi:hypothetical protein
MKPLTRVLLIVIFLQILHTGRVEADRVLGVVDVLAEDGETICFARRAALTSSVDNFACIAEVTTTMILAP